MNSLVYQVALLSASRIRVAGVTVMLNACTNQFGSGTKHQSDVF
jgi:hypothetical protein